MTSPSAILSRAADLIRDTAGLALAPPWSTSGRSIMRGADEDHEVALTPTTTTARWIALMSPAVAADLSALMCALDERDYDSARVIGQRLPRAVLGEKEDTDG